MKSTGVKVFGIAAWRLVPNEPRHNTWHNALHDASKKRGIDLEYLGLNNTYKTNWITQLLPDSVLKRFPYLSLYSFAKVLRKIRGVQDKRTVIYIFEGSVSWAFFLGCISALTPNCVAIVNLFPSSRYNLRFFCKGKMKLVYRIMFKLIQRQGSLRITFDTQLMINKVNEQIENELARFPVPSSFPFNPRSALAEDQHYRVLVNLRSFPNKDIHELLQASCKDCTFVFPRGPLASTPLSIEFGQYTNASFDEFAIPVTEYQNYIDTFDYMIFLYQPSIDASGRILDSITRGVPVCVPRQASEWAFIAKTWGRAALFNWGSAIDTARMFNHPQFSVPVIDSIPPFTPGGSLEEIVNNGPVLSGRRSISSRILRPFIYISVFLHSIAASSLSFGYQLIFWINKHAAFWKNQK